MGIFWAGFGHFLSIFRVFSEHFLDILGAFSEHFWVFSEHFLGIFLGSSGLKLNISVLLLLFSDIFCSAFYFWTWYRFLPFFMSFLSQTNKKGNDLDVCSGSIQETLGDICSYFYCCLSLVLILLCPLLTQVDHRVHHSSFLQVKEILIPFGWPLLCHPLFLACLWPPKREIKKLSLSFIKYFTPFNPLFEHSDSNLRLYCPAFLEKHRAQKHLNLSVS